MIELQNELSRWRELGKADPCRLTEGRLNLHWAVQIVSAVGTTYLPPKPDDSHTNLEWLTSHGVLAGNLLEWKRPIRAAIRPYDLMLQLLDANRELITEFSLQQSTYESGIEWMSDQLQILTDQPLTRSLARGSYDLPKHAISQNATFSADALLLKEIALWFSNADLVLRKVAEQMANVSPVRCWPHHFDIGVIIDLGDGKSIGIGMEPGDEYYDQPYWYVRAYPEPLSPVRPELAGGGLWNETGWQAALLLGTKLAGTSPGDEQCRQIGAFLDSAIGASKQILGVA